MLDILPAKKYNVHAGPFFISFFGLPSKLRGRASVCAFRIIKGDIMSMMSKKNEYAAAHYDRVSMFIPKGGRDRLRALAEELDIRDRKGQISVSRLIVLAVERAYGIDLGSKSKFQ